MFTEIADFSYGQMPSVDVDKHDGSQVQVNQGSIIIYRPNMTFAGVLSGR